MNMNNLRELQIESQKTDQEIMNFIRANPGALQNNQTLVSLRARKTQLVREINNITLPERKLNESEKLELQRILRKTEITRSNSEKQFLAQMINLK